MKKNILTIASCIFLSSIIISCDSTSSTNSNTEQTANDSIKTVTAKYLSGGSSEGDGILVFQKEDGDTIEFYRNYLNPDEPKLKYEFLSAESVSANPELVGSTFVINYKLNPKGQISMVTGEGEACNQILSIEKK